MLEYHQHGIFCRLYYSCKLFTIIFVQETGNVVSTGPNEAVAMSRNLVSMLENAPLADGDGEFFSGEDEIRGVGMQISSSTKKL
jgi:hypothetical protein